MATSTQQQPPPSLNLISVLSESKRIINAHSRHFLALSVLFLLPLSFSFTVFPSLLLSRPHRRPHLNPSLLAGISAGDSLLLPYAAAALYALFLSLLSLLAAASITSSVLRGFYGRPVRLLSTLRSSAAAFLPLLATSLIVLLIAAAFALIAALALFLALLSANLLTIQVDYSSPFFLAPLAFLLLALLAALVLLHLSWTLFPPIVAAESDWGFSALRRSAGLLRGMRGVAASLLAFLALSAAAIAWVAISLAAREFRPGWWESLESVFLVAVASAFLTVVLLYSVAANTVLYMYCKAAHGELVAEIAEEFAAEYVSLPFDDHKVPHVVSVACA